MARVIDIGGVLDNVFVQHKQGDDPWKEAAKALANDWRMVGHDFRKAMRQLECSIALNEHDKSVNSLLG